MQDLMPPPSTNKTPNKKSRIYTDIESTSSKQSFDRYGKNSKLLNMNGNVNNNNNSSNGSKVRNIRDYYEIDDVSIGEGVCGIVYKAVENKTGKIWAVKVVKLKNANMATTADVMKEAEIMTEIGFHPNIIHLKEVE